MLTPGRSERFFSLASLLIFSLFAASVINHAFFFMPDGDEAYNATTAKNWLLGYGYSSSIGVIFPFDPYITAGPAYTFLIAIPIKIFGNNLDVIKPFMGLVHLLLLGMFLLLARPLAGSASRFFAFVFFCLGFFCIVEFRFWHRSGGELLSLLYFVNAALLLDVSWRKQSSRAALLGGLFAVFSVLTKTQIWLCVAGLCVAMLFASVADLCKKNKSWLCLAKLWAAFLLAPVVLLSAWHYYKSGSLAQFAIENPDLYDYYLGKQWNYFSMQGSGLNLLWEIHSFSELVKREGQLIHLAFWKFSSGFARFEDYKALGGAGLLLAVFAVSILGVFDFFREGKTALFFLVLPLLSFFAWAFFLNNSVFMHQLLPGIWLAVFASGLAFTRIQWFLTALGVLAFAVVGLTADRFGEYACLETGNNAACIYTKPNPVRKSLQKALEYLQTHNLPAPLADCGYFFAQDIEFSLPGVNNIQDCMRLFDDAVEFDASSFVSVNKLPDSFRTEKTSDELKKLFVHKRNNLFGAKFVAPVIWKKPIEFTFVANIYMVGDGPEFKRYVMDFLKYCDNKLFVDEYYYIQQCSYENIQSYVGEWRGLPIVTHEWEALYYRDFLRETKPKTPLGWLDAQ